MSKAALDMQTRSRTVPRKGEGIGALALHPGWMVTDMGGPNAALDAAWTAHGTYRVIDGHIAQTPRFVQQHERPLRW